MFRWIRSINPTNFRPIWTRVCEDIAIREVQINPPLRCPFLPLNQNRVSTTFSSRRTYLIQSALDRGVSQVSNARFPIVFGPFLEILDH